MLVGAIYYKVLAQCGKNVSCPKLHSIDDIFKQQRKFYKSGKTCTVLAKCKKVFQFELFAILLRNKNFY